MENLLRLAISNLEYVGFAVLIPALLYWYLTSQTEEAVILKRFGLSSTNWRLMGHDLGRGGKPYHVRGLGLIGTPDLVANSRRSKTIRVYDYKHRRYRGRLRQYEIYQVVLYALVLEAMHPGWNVVPLIKFKDQIIEVGITPARRHYPLSKREEFKKFYASIGKG